MKFIVFTNLGRVDQEWHGPMEEQDAIRLKELFEKSNPGFALTSDEYIVPPRLAAILPWGP